MVLEAHSSGTIGIYDHRSLLTAKVGMLKKTKMVDYLKEVSEELGEPTEQYDEEKEAVLDEYKVLKSKINELNEQLNQPDFQNASKTMRNSTQLLEYLSTQHGIPETIIDDVYNYAKFNYEI